MTTQTDFHPQAFINQLFELDEIAAVRIANIWGSDSTNHDQYMAACSVIERQTVFPTCEHCTWPVVNKDEHADCERNISGDQDEDDEPYCIHCNDEGCTWCDPSFDDDLCPGGCGEPERLCVCAELESLRRYNATPLEERCGPWTA